MNSRLVDPLPDHSIVAVLGLGEAGRAACRLLGLLGKRVIASDRRTDLALDLGAHVELRGGGNEIGDATAAVLSPGLNPEWPENRDNPALAPLWSAAREERLELWSEVELAIAAFGGPAVTIGGTDGKSTTAAMTRDLLEASGNTVLFGGNSWTALSEVLCGDAGSAVCVAEVSAFQLWEGHRLHPRVAVLTNIAPDHLDHYADESGYVQAKLHVLRHLCAGDVAVLFAADERLLGLRDSLRARGVFVCGYSLDNPGEGWDRKAWVEGDELVAADASATFAVPASRLTLPGSHNRKNALAALLAARAASSDPRRLSTESVGRALTDFRGLPHRLEPVRELDGVLWLDDSKATNIHAAVTGLSSLDRPVVAIVGGVDKQLDLTPLFDALDRSAHHVVIIGGLSDRFCAEAAARPRAGAWKLERAAALADAVSLARSAARSGDAVVLSPGCSSFDMFRSFEDRGRQFRRLVEALQG